MVEELQTGSRWTCGTSMIYYSKRISLKCTATSSRERPTPGMKFLFGFSKADRVNAHPLELTGIGARISVHLLVGARYDRGV